jgi:hypothetical protein
MKPDPTIVDPKFAHMTEEEAKHLWRFSPETRQEFTTVEALLAYIKNLNAGRIPRI